MEPPTDNEIVELVERWGAHFGWYDNRIDLRVDDLSSFATPDATLTGHAPVWGTKEGAERAMPIAEVRKRLARLSKLARATRHDMHLAIHPDGEAICLFVRLEVRLAFLPIKVRTEPLAFVIKAIPTGKGLRVSKVDEWSAADPAVAARIVVDHHGWPADTALHHQVAFGAAS